MKHQTLIENSRNSLDPAVVYLCQEYVDIDTKKQINAMMQNASIKHVRVMPDCHVGQGCCIGFTSIVEHDKIVPSYVGGDIGCGK
jgi:RNA-splicing ligase RtcB